MPNSTSHNDGGDHETATMFAFVDGPKSGLVVCCGAFLGLLLGMSLTLLLLKHFGVIWTCSGLMLLFLGPLVWAFSRKETVSEDETKQRSTHPLDQTWVISFWCVCSLVLLLVAAVA